MNTTSSWDFRFDLPFTRLIHPRPFRLKRIFLRRTICIFGRPPGGSPRHTSSHQQLVLRDCVSHAALDCAGGWFHASLISRWLHE